MQKIKRWISMLLCCVMLLGYFPATASAAEPQSIWVGGVEMADGAYLAVGASETTTQAPGDNYAHYAGGVLTLHNYSYTGDGYQYGDHENNSAAVYSYDSIQLVLDEGTVNTIDATKYNGFFIQDALAVSGNGSLVMTAVERCFDVSTTATVNGGNLDLTAGYSGLVALDVVINGGTVKITAETAFPMYPYYSVVFNGGTVILDGYYGLHSQGNTTISGGTVECIGTFSGTTQSNINYIYGSLTARVREMDENYDCTAFGSGSTFTYSDGAVIRAAKDLTSEPGEFNPDELDSYAYIKVTAPEGKYPVVVENGTGTDLYAPGETVTVTANTEEIGKIFSGWEGMDSLTLTSGSAADTTVSFTMPAATVKVKATYIDATIYDVLVDGDTYGSYYQGETVTVYADEAEQGMAFEKWTGLEGLKLSDSTETDMAITFTMPGKNVELTQNYVTGYEIWVGGIGMNDGDYLASGASATTTEAPADNYAHYSAGVLTLHNFSCTGDGYQYQGYEDDWALVYANAPVKLVLDAGTANTLTAKKGHGIKLGDDMDETVEITGTGKLSVTAPLNGLYIFNSLVINGGTLEVTADYSAFETKEFTLNQGKVSCLESGTPVYSYGDITVNGGTLFSDSVDALTADGDIYINGGTVEINAATEGTRAQSITFSGGTYKETNAQETEDDDYYVLQDCGAIHFAHGMAAKASAEPGGTLGEYAEADIATYDRIEVSMAEGAYLVSVIGGTGAGGYFAGETVTVTANETPEGKTFGGWSGAEGITVTSGAVTEESFSFTMPEKAVALSVIWEEIPKYKVTVVGGNDYEGGEYQVGDTVLVESNDADAGHIFYSWSGTEGLKIVNGSTFTSFMEFIMPAHDVKLTANFGSDYPVWVGGVGMNEGDYLAAGATKTTTTAPKDKYAHYEDGILTLHNYSYTGAGFKGAAIYSVDELQILLEGKNTLRASSADEETAIEGICVDELTVSGAGALEIVSEDESICTYGFCLLGGDLDLTSTESDGIFSTDGSVILSGGSLTIDAMDDGIYVGYGDLNVSMDKLSVKAQDDGIFGNYVTVEINGSNTVIDAGDDGIDVEDATILLNGSNTVITADDNGIDGVYTNVAIGGSTVITAEDCGIDADYEITVAADLKINAAVGIQAYDGYFEICGGITDITARNNGIWLESEGSFYVSGGEATVRSTNTAEDTAYCAISSIDAIEVDSFLKITASTEPNGTLGDYVSENRDTYDLVKIASTEEIYVGGVKLADGDYLASGATAATTKKPADNYAYYADGVLTLHNYSYTGQGYVINDVDSAAIFAMKDLKLVLEGKNTLTAESETLYAMGVSVKGALDISGTGSIRVTSVAYGIEAGTNLSVSEGTFHVETKEADCFHAGNLISVSGGTYTLSSEGGDCFDARSKLTVSGGKITGEASSDCLEGDFVVVSGGEMELTSTGGDGIDASQKATVSGGKINLITSDCSVEAYDFHMTGGELTVNADTSGIFTYNDVVIDGGTLDVTAKNTDQPNDTAGIYGYGNVTVNGGTITVVAEEDALFSFEEDVKIYGGTVTLTSKNADGIDSDDADVEIYGGVITVTAADNGIEAMDDVEAENARITVTADGNGISANDDMRFFSGMLTVDAKEHGLNVGDSLEINGGYMDIKSLAEDDEAWCSIYCDSLEIADNVSVSAAETPDGKLGEFNKDKISTYDRVVTVAPHTHIYGDEYLFDEESHWRVCSDPACYVKEGAVTEPEKHFGGEATCQKKAECEVCGEAYGETAHRYSETWTDVDSDTHAHKCIWCDSYDGSADHSYDDNADAVCDTCGHRRDLPLLTLTVENGAGSGSYAMNTVVNISADVPKDAVFTGWVVLTEDVDVVFGNAAKAKTTLTMPGTAVSVKATFKFPVQVNNGTASCESAAEGETVTVSAPKKDGCKVFSKWKVNAGEITLADASATSISFTMPAGAVELTAVYTVSHYGGKATCQAKAKCESCGEEYGKLAKHSYETDKWSHVEAGGHARKCIWCDTHSTVQTHVFGDWTTTKAPAVGVPGEEMHKCNLCGYKETRVIPALEEKPDDAEIIRLAGPTRYETALEAADELKTILKVDKFSCIIVASGTEFADALAGSYLASVKSAPILLVRARNQEMDAVKAYIKANLTPGGTVYLLGGENAVSKNMESGLNGFNVKRLGGATRYETNLLILKEAGVGNKDIIVCTGQNFADSLSASAAGLPILLVKGGLTDSQKDFLKGTSGKKIIVGGTAAVNATVETQLKTYGTVKRLAGATRYETSVLVAKEFFTDPTAAVLAYARNFPDGLSGGPVAYAIGAPLLLTEAGREKTAADYISGKGITGGYVLGGTAVLPEETVNQVFAKN